jgi:hypothetical protein
MGTGSKVIHPDQERTSEVVRYLSEERSVAVQIVVFDFALEQRHPVLIRQSRGEVDPHYCRECRLLCTDRQAR